MELSAISSKKMESITPKVTMGETKPITLVPIGEPKEKQKERVYIVDGGAPRTLYAKDLERMQITNIKVKDTDVNVFGKMDAGKITVKNGSFTGEEVTAKEVVARKSDVKVADITEGAKVRGTNAERSSVKDGDHTLTQADATKFSGKTLPNLAIGATIIGPMALPFAGLAVGGGPGFISGFVYGLALNGRTPEGAAKVDNFFKTNFNYDATK